MSKKTYVGAGRGHETYELVNFHVCLSDIPKEDITEYKDKKYIHLTIARRKEPDKAGRDYTVYLDNFKKDETPF